MDFPFCGFSIEDDRTEVCSVSRGFSNVNINANIFVGILHHN